MKKKEIYEKMNLEQRMRLSDRIIKKAVRKELKGEDTTKEKNELLLISETVPNEEINEYNTKLRANADEKKRMQEESEQMSELCLRGIKIELMLEKARLLENETKNEKVWTQIVRSLEKELDNQHELYGKWIDTFGRERYEKIMEKERPIEEHYIDFLLCGYYMTQLSRLGDYYFEEATGTKH